jgi:hemolysin-activating ACP:hemolysin acyltransferase
MMGADGRTSLFRFKRATTFQEIQGDVLCSRCELTHSRWCKANKQVVMQLLAPLSHLKGITSVAEVFRDAEDARKVVQEKVAGEMDNL